MPSYNQFSWKGFNFSEKARSEGVSPIETFENDRSMSKRVYYVAWSSRAGQALTSVVATLLGSPTLATASSGQPYISRSVPHSLVEWQSFSRKVFLYATKVETKGLGPVGTNDAISFDGIVEKVGKYNVCELTVTYQTLSYDILSDQEMLSGGLATINGAPDESTWKRYITKIVRPQGEFLTIPSSAGSYQFVLVPPKIITQGVSKLLISHNMQITWHEVPENAVPSSLINPNLSNSLGAQGSIETTLGKVNNAVFANCRAGTVLLMGVEFKPYRSSFGERIFDITYMFKYFEPANGKGHQYIFRPLSAAWIEVTTTGTSNVMSAGLGGQVDGRSIYDWADFSKLFRPP